MRGLILTAAPAGGGMGELFGDVPSALVPLNGRPVLLSILHELEQCGVRDVTLAVGHRAAEVRALCTRFRSSRVALRFVDVDPRDSAGGALAAALAHFDAGDRVLVHLGDTHVPTLAAQLPDRPAVMVSADVPDAGRWCGVNVASDGAVQAFIERDAVARPDAVAVGIYLTDALPARLPPWPSRPEISDVLLALAPAPVWQAQPVTRWHDVGHLDRYQVARKRVLEARSFNTLQFDDFLGTVTKRSRHWEKLQDEVRWALALPPALSVLAPRVLSFVEDGPRSQVTMEYYGYPTAAELWLYSSLPAPVMSSVVLRLADVLDRFAAHPQPLQPADVLHMYRDKTEARLAQVRRDSPVLRQLLDAPRLVVDGQDQPGWPDLWARAQAHLPALYDPAHATLLHGDYCLSNILYDIGGGIVRVIDARGRWARGGGLGGDLKYDVAKLRHSVAGGYDFIVADLFDVEHDGCTLALQDARDARHRAVAQALDGWIARRFDLAQVQLVESLLFLSMLPLHEDRPRRQLAMFTRGIGAMARALDALEARMPAVETVAA